MSQPLQVAWLNILETGTVTVSSQAVGYPAYRFYDRKIGPMWEGTSTADQTIFVDQGGGSPQAVDTLIIPEGHNLAGATISWQNSTDNASWSDAVTPFVAGSGTILKQMIAPQAKRYWRLVIHGASTAPQIAELFVTLLVTIGDPDAENTRFGKQQNVDRTESKSGVTRFSVNGRDRAILTYPFDNIPESLLATFIEWDAAWGGANPFFLIDHRGNIIFAELLDRLQFDVKESFLEGSNCHATSLRILEVIG